METAQKNNNSSDLRQPCFNLLLVVAVTLFLKPLLFVQLITARLNLDLPTQWLYRAETEVLENFLQFESIRHSNFFLLRVRQLQGSIITEYYKKDFDAEMLAFFLEPSLRLLANASRAPKDEVAKMYLFMSAISICMSKSKDATTFANLAAKFDPTAKQPVRPLDKCE